MTGPQDLFGRVRLGYVLVESRRIDEWQRFAGDGLGLHTDRVSRDVLALRIDDHERRLVVQRGPSEDVGAIGWQLDDEAALQLALARLQQMGVAVTGVDDYRAALRGVEKFWTFVGPKRQSMELFVRPRLATDALAMRASGFLTAAGGMGHIAIPTRRPDSMLAFWQQVFDARLSDRIEERIDGLELDLAFLRVNERHHSIAIAATRGLRMNAFRTGIHHLNFEAARLDDVTESYVRCRSLGYTMANGIGQHPNDRELSFYVVSPSGFEIELGWNPIRVDERTWQPIVHQGISLWGHRPENPTAGSRFNRIVRGLLSLARPEYSPGEA